jgi:hypothetical protein
MGARLKREEEIFNIPMNTLRYGDIAITQEGQIVVKVDDEMESAYIAIGENSGERFCIGCDIPVRILQPGEIIEIT